MELNGPLMCISGGSLEAYGVWNAGGNALHALNATLHK